MKKFLFVWGTVLIFSAGTSFAPAQTVKFACWNLLNYPDLSSLTPDTTLRHPFYRAVVQYINPDILVTEENNSSYGTLLFLNDVLNAGGNNYSKGTFINGPDTDNEIYFRTSLFSFVSNRAIQTDLRDINEFTLVHTATGDTLRVYAVHLKASSGAPYDAQRALEVDSLRHVTNQLATGKNFIVCGDFNFYSSAESGYQKLLLDNPNDDGNFVDPISMTGTWNNAIYRSFHTQSTRTASFGGGASGGLNDRFDLILFSTAISQGLSGISYVPASTVPVGNDGNHYNLSINTLPNTAAPVTVLNALYNASDHLPVSALFNFSSPAGLTSPGTSGITLSVFPNPAGDVVSIRSEHVSMDKIEILDLSGRKIMDRKLSGENQTELDVSHLTPAVYFLQIFSGDYKTIYRLVKK